MFARGWRSDVARRTAGSATALLFGLVACLAAPLPAAAQPEFRAPPPCLYSTDLRDGTRLCVRKETYSRDICTAIERVAVLHGLPPEFFARLIWRESLFRPNAVSPKGAEGIAQFMPGTARLRRLNNSFHALEALDKSAEYLAALRDQYGNLGLAAAAYNAGEGGLGTFLATGRLPFETRAYVIAITAHSAEEWKETPPEKVDLALAKDKPFVEACIALADTRRLQEITLPDEGNWAPWGVQLASHPSKPAAYKLFMIAVERLPAPLSNEKPYIKRQVQPGFGTRPRYTARIGRETRKEADSLCSQIRSAGGACIVFRN